MTTKQIQHIVLGIRGKRKSWINTDLKKKNKKNKKNTT